MVFSKNSFKSRTCAATWPRPLISPRRAGLEKRRHVHAHVYTYVCTHVGHVYTNVHTHVGAHVFAGDGAHA